MNCIDLIFIGPPGSGKGTQAKMLASSQDYAYLEMGEELRKLAETDEQIRKMITEGVLVPHEITYQIVHKKLDGLSDNQILVFDGFPRSLDQLAELKKIEKDRGRTFQGLLIEVSDEEVISRLTRGAEDRQGRTDDNMEGITKRLEVFRSEAMLVAKQLEKQGLLIAVNGEQAREEVQNEICKKLGI